MKSETKYEAAFVGTVIIIILLLSLLSSCSSAGRIIYESEDCTVTVEQPGEPNGQASLTINKDGTMSANVPQSHAPASYTERATVNWLMVFGGLAGLCAVLLFAFKGKFPLMPSNAPVGFAIASVACFMLPTIIAEYLPWILGGVALWGGWVYYSYRHNKKLKAETP